MAVHARAKRCLLATFVAATLIPGAKATLADEFPSRAITIVVPYGAGGSTDFAARALAEHMRVTLKQTVVVENAPGASGSIGVGRVVRAPADGYTLSIGSISTHVLNGASLPLQYDLRTSFEPIGLLGSEPLVIVTKKAMPAKNLAELIAWLKENPNKALQGNTGEGSAAHVAGLFFQEETGTRFHFVPYHGFPDAMRDLVAGRIDLMFTPASNASASIKSDLVKTYAVMGKKHISVAPAVPTVDEAGLPGLYMSVWQAIWAPKGTPKAVINTLNGALVSALTDATVRGRFAKLGQELPDRDGMTPETLGALHQAEIKKWWPIIKDAKSKLQ
jgi:tripartite-type tricarboxylate transporter receptor subunit TctC